jgi:hypothetical protein
VPISPGGNTFCFLHLPGYVLTAKGVVNLHESSFRSFTRDEHISTFTEMMTGASVSIHNYTKPDSLLASVRALAPLCKTINELEYVAGIQKVLQLCAENSITGMSTSLCHASSC